MEFKTVKEQLNALLENITDKAQIDKVVEISKNFDELEQDHQSMISKNVELTNAYKEALLHPSIQKANGKDPGVKTASEALSFEDSLNKWTKEHSTKK